jgi:hypothetical protein
MKSSGARGIAFGIGDQMVVEYDRFTARPLAATRG